MRKKYDGPVFSVPMFFNEDNSIDYHSLEKYLLKICSMSCVQAVYSMSYNTRYMQLSFDEIIQVNQFIAEICLEYSVSFICGHPITCTETALLKYAEKLDLCTQATLSVLYPERYFGINKVLYRYHQAPISLGYDILIHEMKLTSGFDGNLVDWQIENLSMLLENPKVVGIKEDSKNDDIAIEMISRYGKNKNIIVAGGGKRRVMRLRGAGLRSWLNGSLMMFPEVGDRFMKAYTEYDQQFLTKFERKIEAPLFDKIIAKYGWHVGHKAVLSHRGFCKPIERSPMPIIPTNCLTELNNVIHDIEKSISEMDL